MLDRLTAKTAVKFAIKTEEIGAKVYTKLAKRFGDDEELKELFEQLARDEVSHGESFRKLLTQVPEEESSAGEEQLQYLRAMSISEFFAGEGGLAARGEVKTREDALDRAFGLEKATLGFYEAIRDVMGDSDALQAIIAAEKRHVVSIMRFMITGAKVRGMP